MNCPFNAEPSAPQPGPADASASASGCPVQHHDAKLDFSADRSYGDYLTWTPC